MFQRDVSGYRRLFWACLLTLPLLLSGCGAGAAKDAFRAADGLFRQGSYAASLEKYTQIIGQYPEAADRALFEKGTVYAHPANVQKDYDKALASFDLLLKKYPDSPYKHDSEMMIFYVNNVLKKNQEVEEQKYQVDLLRQELKNRDQQAALLQKQIEQLEQKIFFFAAQAGPVEKILIEKSERRLKLIAKGEVIKTYKIALGGDPVGPKERQGDLKTPEGIYTIDSKNTGSQYHLSLHISYPNERDRQRAKELGVAPGGDIMIHGIKNGFAWVGSSHSEVDWTKGCIAVTDAEIEEIDRLAPIGTVVEIKP